jgi:hypothetical protein
MLTASTDKRGFFWLILVSLLNAGSVEAVVVERAAS